MDGNNRRRLRICVHVVATLGLLTCWTGAAAAGGVRPDRLGVWLGLSYNSPEDQFLGMTPGRDFHELGFRLVWDVIGNDLIGANYFVDLFPLALVTGNPVYRTSTIMVDGEMPRWIVGHETKYGIGAAPIGLNIGFFRRSSVKPFVAGSAGFLAFNGEVPSFGATHFNFTFDFGGGAEIPLNDKVSLYGGYRFHHLSNANTSYENPGIDSNMFYAGTTWVH